MNNFLNWLKKRGPFIATLILIVAIPLYPKFPLHPIEGTWVSIRLDDIIVAIAILVCFISQALKGFPLFKSRILKLIFLFWAAGLIANLGAFGISGLVSVNLAMLHWLRRIQYMSLFFLGYQAVNKKEDIRDIKVFIGLTLIAVLIYALGQKYWRFPVISTMNEEFAKGQLLYLDRWVRVSSTFAGHYDLAGWLVMILAILPSVIMMIKKWWWRLAGFIAGIIGLYLMVLTASRVSFVAYLIAITITLLLIRKFKWLTIVLLVSLAFGMTSKELSARLMTNIPHHEIINQKITYLTDTWENQQEKIGQGIKHISEKRKKPTPIDEVTEKISKIDEEPDEVAVIKEEEDDEIKEKELRELRTWPTPEEAAVAAARSSSIRFEVEWPRAIRAFLKNPLIGSGYSSLGLATDNDYLRMLGEIGIIGFSSFILVILHLLNSFWLSVKNKSINWKYGAGFIGIIIGIVANAFYIDIFAASKVAFYFWLLMGIGYKIVNSEQESVIGN